MANASFITAAWPNKIVNIHPALLPAYGGKGMYGHHVHEAVIAAGEKESGITIHYVNDHYDQGAIIFQAKCPVLPTDTPTTLPPGYMNWNTGISGNHRKNDSKHGRRI